MKQRDSICSTDLRTNVSRRSDAIPSFVDGQMPEAKKQKVIRIETNQRMLIRSRGKIFRLWCRACETETLMLTLEQAAIIHDTTQLAIFRRIENGELHFMEATKGVLFVCGNSLEIKNTKKGD